MPWPWHSAQLADMPVWLKAEDPKVGDPVMGVVAMLEPLPTWQLSQPKLRMGTWVAPGPTMVRLALL